MYADIIEPIGTDAREKNRQYQAEYDRMITKFTIEFGRKYCTDDGNINWNDIIKLNSGAKKQ